MVMPVCTIDYDRIFHKQDVQQDHDKTNPKNSIPEEWSPRTTVGTNSVSVKVLSQGRNHSNNLNRQRFTKIQLSQQSILLTL